MRFRQTLLTLLLIILSLISLTAHAENVNYKPAELKKLEQQVQQNNTDAIQKITRYYFSRQEYKKAYQYILDGVKLHDLGSLGNQGIYLVEGLAGVKKDYKKGLKQILAAKKDSPSMYNELGLIYANGYGVAKDPNKARDYYEKAIHLGSEDAEFNLAMLMSHYHPKLAFEMFHALAIYKKDPMAMIALGLAYQIGMGVKVDYVKAYKWNKITENLGVRKKNMAKALQTIEKKMTPAQIAEGKQLVKEYYAEQSNSE